MSSTPMETLSNEAAGEETEEQLENIIATYKSKQEKLKKSS